MGHSFQGFIKSTETAINREVSRKRSLVTEEGCRWWEALGRATTIKEEAIHGPCQKCWRCRQEDMIPVFSHKKLRNLLACRLLDAGPMLSKDLAAFFFKNKAEVWPPLTPNILDEVLRKTCNCSVLKLIASKILAPEMAIKSDKPAVMLKWG
jgi:hypothetical protein